MRKIFLVLFPLVAFADPMEGNTCLMTQEANGEWRIVCEGDGLQYQVVDVTNDLYIIENCQSLKTNLFDVIRTNHGMAIDAERQVTFVQGELEQLKPHISTREGTNIWTDIYWDLMGVKSKVAYIQTVMSSDDPGDPHNLYNQVDSINCGECSTDGGGSGSCCDFGPIIERLIAAEKQRVAISNQIARISYSAKNNLALYSGSSVWWYYGKNFWSRENPYIPKSPDEIYSLPDMIQSIMWNNINNFSSINNFLHDYALPAHISLDSPSTLLYFDSSVEERDYYTYLTNYYFGMVRKDSEIPSNYRTNWFARIETLLAALVFNDGGNTNYYDSSQNAISNSFQQVYDDFEYRMTGISDFSTEQMKLVNKVQSSMYNNLLSFSRAFEDAALPSTVQIINVHKDTGARSLSSDSIDVSLDVDGKLLDFIEILRSASTLCWVFLGLWMMFKFSVWTVKKIYVLIRYIIDFFNMVLGGK